MTGDYPLIRVFLREICPAAFYRVRAGTLAPVPAHLAPPLPHVNGHRSAGAGREHAERAGTVGAPCCTARS